MRQRILLPTVSLVFTALTVFLGYFVHRIDFQTFILAYGVFFSCYAWLVFARKSNWTDQQTRYLIGLGVALRFCLLFSLPGLSDDYARFLWDGHLSLAGIHPFAHPPVYFIEHQIFPQGITRELFEKLNSPNYYTVYPPVCQLVFALAAWLFPKTELAAVIVLKLFLLLCEMGTLRILYRMDKHPGTPKKAGIIYALNPLLILEISGNCHFEGAMIFFLLAGLGSLSKQKLYRGAIYWTLATACKMLPIMFLPIVWRWLGWRKGLHFVLLFGLVCLLLFAPILSEVPHMLQSLDLYFRQFQFNASIYYLVRVIGFSRAGWDIGETSGPALGALTMIGVLLIAWKTKVQDWENSSNKPADMQGLGASLLWANMLYLALSATVQPWYVCVPLALCLVTSWRVGVLWSGLVALSYSHYDQGGFKEHFEWISLEYILLGVFFLWEFRHILTKKPASISV